MKVSTRLPWALAGLAIALAGGCSIKDDTESFHYLDSLRVLGVRAEPADLAPGEQATLSALVFEPDDAEVSYAWSWCPVRGGAADGFECAFEEDALRVLWAELGASEALPPFDLGSGPTAEFTHVFTDELVAGLCASLLAEGAAEVDPRAILGCLDGLSVSVQLRVRAGGDEVVALRELSLLGEALPEDERNRNPVLEGPLGIRLFDGPDDDLGADAVLREGAQYALTAPIAPEQAETFLPPKLEGLDEPQPRRESLFLSWFVTAGENRLDMGDGQPPDEDDDRPRQSERTTFADGQVDFDYLTGGVWEFPPTVEQDEARLYLVLRDERGGMGWAEYRFAVEGGR